MRDHLSKRECTPGDHSILNCMLILLAGFVSVAQASDELTPTEKFKALLSNPEPVEEMLFLEKRPREQGKPPSLEDGIAGSTNYSVGFLAWEPGSMVFRTLATTNLPVSPDADGPAFTFHNNRFSFIDGRTNVLVYELEHKRVEAGEFPPTFDAATYRLRRTSEPLNLGLSHLLPGSVRWDGDHFHATGSADKKRIHISGEISDYSNGVPTGLRVQYSNDMGVANYRIAYTYASARLGDFPETIRILFNYKGREIEYRTYTILKRTVGKAPLPDRLFDAFSYVPRSESTVRLSTNDSLYVVMPSGRLLETPSAAAPKVRLTKNDFYRNRYIYVLMGALTIGFGVLLVKSAKSGTTNHNQNQTI